MHCRPWWKIHLNVILKQVRVISKPEIVVFKNVESWGKSLITGEMETVFKREGKGLLSRLAFRKAPVSKSQENIMFPKVNTQKSMSSSESRPLTLLDTQQFSLGTFTVVIGLAWYNLQEWWPEEFKKLEMHSLPNAGLSLQLEDLGHGGSSRSLRLQQGKMHVFSLGDLIQAGTPQLTASLRWFLFLHIYFSLPQDTN